MRNVSKEWITGDYRLGLIIVLTAANFCGLSLTAATSLVSRSPFIPDNFSISENTPAVITESVSPTGLKFKGMYTLGETMYVLISSDQQPGKWVAMDSTYENIVVRQFDDSRDQLLIEHQGQPLWLDLVETASLTGKSPTPSRSSSTGRPTATRVTQGSRPGALATRTVTRAPTILSSSRPEISDRTANLRSSLVRNLQVRGGAATPLRVPATTAPEAVAPSEPLPTGPSQGLGAPPSDTPTFIPEGPDMSTPVGDPFN